MRFSRSLVLIGCLLVSIPALGSSAAQAIHGPVLGFVPNAAGSAVWPILGISGASLLGHRLELGLEIGGAVVSPQQDYVLAVRREDAQIILIRLTSDSLELIPIPGARPGGAFIAISPTGAAAALYDQDSRVLQVLRGLPGAPEIAFEAETSGIPGRATALAVSDDASMALLGFGGEGVDGLWLVNSFGPRPVSQVHASSVAFIMNRHDVVIADDVADEAFLLLRAEESATRIPLVSVGDGVEGVSAAAVSDDGRFAFVAGNRSRTIGIVDLEAGSRTVIACDCQPAGIHRLAGAAIFRLNDPPDDAVAVVDVSSGEPRIWVIPPEAKVAAVAEEQPQ